MDESNNPGNRRSRRANVLLAATIELSGVSLQVKLRNLSEQGALIETDKPPVEGSEVLFRRNDLSVPGRVAWVEGKHAGITFANCLQPQEVMRHIPQPKPRVQTDHRRPPLNPRALSPQEQHLLDTWFRNVAIKPE